MSLPGLRVLVTAVVGYLVGVLTVPVLDVLVGLGLGLEVERPRRLVLVPVVFLGLPFAIAAASLGSEA